MTSTAVFLIGVAVATVLVAGLFLLAYVLLRRRAIAADADRTGVISGLLGLVLGTAATLAGAYASLQVAELGLSVSQRQETRDAIAFVEDTARTVVALYRDLGLRLSEVNAAGVLVAESERGGLLGQGYAFERQIRAIGDLHQAIRALHTNPVALACFHVQRRARPLFEDFIRARVQDLPPDERFRTPSVADLIDISLLLERARFDLTATGQAMLDRARTLTDRLRERTDVTQEWAAVYYAGIVLYGETIRDQARPRASVTINFGAALIHDLFASLPDGDAIKACIRERYPTVADSVEHVIVDFDPLATVGETLGNGLTAFPEDAVFLPREG